MLGENRIWENLEVEVQEETLAIGNHDKCMMQFALSVDSHVKYLLNQVRTLKAIQDQFIAENAS